MIGDHVDAYGPFWISTTLLFAIAVSANISSYVHFMGSSSEKEFVLIILISLVGIGDGGGWEYDFQIVLTCASLGLMFVYYLNYC